MEFKKNLPYNLQIQEVAVANTEMTFSNNHSSQEQVLHYKLVNKPEEVQYLSSTLNFLLCRDPILSHVVYSNLLQSLSSLSATLYITQEEISVCFQCGK